MGYFASYFALFFALGALIGFFVGYVYRGPGQAKPATAAAPASVAPVLPPDDELAALPGMTAAVAANLAGAGVRTLPDLRAAGASDDGLLALADTLRLEDFALRKWVGMANLQAIDGIDVDLAHALQRIGIKSVQDLAGENPDRVQNKLAALHETEALPAAVPQRKAVGELIEAAARL